MAQSIEWLGWGGGYRWMDGRKDRRRRKRGGC